MLTDKRGNGGQEDKRVYCQQNQIQYQHQHTTSTHHSADNYSDTDMLRMYDML